MNDVNLRLTEIKIGFFFRVNVKKTPSTKEKTRCHNKAQLSSQGDIRLTGPKRAVYTIHFFMKEIINL